MNDYSSMRDEFLEIHQEKLAKTRWQKEVEAGNLPELSKQPVSTARAQFASHASRDADELERTRALSLKKHVAGLKHHGVKDAFLPGIGPATTPNNVYAPLKGGQVMRGVADSGPLRRIGIALGTASSMPMLPKPVQSALGKLIPKDTSSDRTMSHAVFRHELSERDVMNKAMNRGSIQPFATHFGVRPIIEEQVALAGDPEARASMDRVRKVHPDDELVQKLVRRAGGTPDSPLPVGGKQERAVERMLDKSVGKLSPTTRGESLRKSLMGVDVSYIPKGLADEGFSSVDDVLRSRSLSDVRSRLGPALGAANKVRKFIQFGR